MLEFQVGKTAVISGARCVVKWRVSFAKRNDFDVIGKGQELSKTPDAAAIASVE